MEQQGLVPDVIFYNSLSSACERGIQLERALEVFRAMQRKAVVLIVITYSELLSAC